MRSNGHDYCMEEIRVTGTRDSSQSPDTQYYGSTEIHTGTICYLTCPEYY
jgi:hypothetical protein